MQGRKSQIVVYSCYSMYTFFFESRLHVNKIVTNEVQLYSFLRKLIFQNGLYSRKIANIGIKTDKNISFFHLRENTPRMSSHPECCIDYDVLFFGTDRKIFEKFLIQYGNMARERNIGNIGHFCEKNVNKYCVFVFRIERCILYTRS